METKYRCLPAESETRGHMKDLPAEPPCKSFISEAPYQRLAHKLSEAKSLWSDWLWIKTPVR
jgi:hypothetical protein